MWYNLTEEDEEELLLPKSISRKKSWETEVVETTLVHADTSPDMEGPDSVTYEGFNDTNNKLSAITKSKTTEKSWKNNWLHTKFILENVF